MVKETNDTYDEDILRLWLTNMEGVGVRTIKKLLLQFKSIREIYEAGYAALVEAVSDKADIITGQKSLSKAKMLYEKYLERNIKIIYPGHRYYPDRLLNIYYYPEILYVKGDARHLDMRGIAVVGSRNPSVYGKEIACHMAMQLAKKNICIISGLARGIDSAAHKGAIAGGGKTIAVLGCGINVTYPRENAELYAAVEKNGAVISEYGLDMPPAPGLFPMRNRIISGMSDGVLVVEARKKSGSLITADMALEQGKQVYSVPGRIFDACSEGTNNLIKQGAVAVTDAEDILFDLDSTKKSDMKAEPVTSELSPQEKKIYSLLSLEPVFIDDIIAKTGCGVTNTISTLYALCEKNLIKQTTEGYYIINICR